MTKTQTETEYTRIIRNANLETSYAAEDFVNPDSFESSWTHPGADGPMRFEKTTAQRAFVVLNAGYVLAIVFSEYYAYSEQDALDAAVDSGKLNNLQCTNEDLADYQIGTDPEGNPEYEGIIHLGNASEPFASESLDVWTLPASVFAEDPALMRPERVLAHLEATQDAAERTYKAIPSAEDPAWMNAYRATVNAKDALTVYRFAQAR